MTGFVTTQLMMKLARSSDDNDVICSSDEKINSSKLKKHNHLSPRARLVHRSLCSTGPKRNEIWRSVSSRYSPDWNCNNPTEDEIRFNDDSNVISSDDSVDEKSNSKKLKKLNDFSPRAKEVYKLLHSTRPEINTIWRTVGSASDLIIKYNEDRIDLNKHSNVLSSDCDSDENRLSVDEEKNYSNSILKRGRSLNLSSLKRSKIQEAAKRIIDFQDKDTESELETLYSVKMSKSHKRKHEEKDSNEEETNNVNRIGKEKNRSLSKSVKHKEKSHNVSHSGSEDVAGHPTIIQNKGQNNLNKPSRNLLNTHLLSSESDEEALPLGFTSSTGNVSPTNDTSKSCEVSDSKHESVENLVEVNRDKNTVQLTTNTTENRKKRIPKLTPELNEDISKFSVLHEENLFEKNDIWILQCPSTMDCSALVNQQLSLGDSCRLSDGERTYETYSYRNTLTRSATLAVPTEHNRLRLCKIPISGTIIVEESIKDVYNVGTNEVISESSCRVEFPENLRVRHPLLGLDFSKQAQTEKVPESVLKKKKKKHSEKHRESYNDDTAQLLDESLSEIVVKKKKKKKHRDNNSFY